MSNCPRIEGDEADKGAEEDEGAEEAEGADRAEWGEVPQRTDRTDVAAIFILSYG